MPLHLERLEDRCLLTLVAAYAFDEGSGTILHDVSGYGNNGTISGATWSTAGKYGDALAFNGTNSLVTLSNSAFLNLTSGATLEAWVDPTSLSSAWRDILYKGGGVYALEASSPTSTDAPAAMVTIGSSTITTDGTSAVANNAWTFLAETYNGKSLMLYVNGVEVSSVAETGSILTSTGSLQIGGDSALGHYFTGMINGIRIYNVALTQTQIQTDMKTPVADTAPLVMTRSPGSSATGVALSSGVTATFDEPMQSSTIDMTLTSSSGATVAGTVSYNATSYTATFTPRSPLAYDTTYTITVSGAKNTAGFAMSAASTWSFTTDVAPPSVSTYTPANGATGIATNTSVTATFNEAVQSSTITTSSFVLKSSSGSTIAANVSFNSSTNTATLMPSALLANSTTYTVTVSGVKDSAGDAMTSAFNWSFTTGPAPSVTSETPASGATGVMVSSPITATFNEAVQSSTITFTLATSSGTSVPATVTYNSSNNTVTLTPTSALAYGTTYTAAISGAKDTAGDPMSGTVSWSFTTDAKQPAVSSYTPGSSATGVAVSSALTATFNEAVQSSTISFTLATSSGTSVPASASYNSSNNTVTLTPSSTLAYGTTYTATVSGAEDTAGDPMSGTVSWSFATDAKQPAVSSYTPGSSATGVAVSSPLTATFNEAVQSSTISFTLTTSSGTSVPATVSYNSSTYAVTLTPSAALAYGTTYTATVSGAKDTAGDPMSGAVSWSFTTDAKQPAVSSYTPGSSATGIAVSSPLTATFNEAVQSSTITFTLATSTGTSVAATLSYNSTNYTATLTPSSALAYGTTYTATISGAKDAAGDPMSGSVSWSFTTDAKQPAVSSYTPASGATGVAASSPLTATFNEAVQSSTIGFALRTSAGTSVPATMSYNASTFVATLTPTSALSTGTTYTATVSGAEDTAGDPMSGSVSWSFTTAASPTVTSETPAPGATGVTTNTTVTATFSLGLLVSSITGSSFFLKSASGSTVAASLSYSSSTNTATLVPSALLANSTTYTATVSGIESLLGVLLPSAFSWSFTTGPAPTVTSETPASGATGVAVTSAITATFNEAVQSSTISFTLTSSAGTSVPATMSYNSSTLTATLTPTSALANGTTYTATLSGAKDTAGDPMSGTASWSFTTVSSSTLTVSAGSNITTTVGSTVTFAGAVSGGASPYNYSWNFGDGTTTAGNSASFVGTDTTTQGNWTAAYGTAGYDVIGASSSLPSYATVTPSGESSWTWAATTTDVRGLLIPGSTSRIAACWYSSSSFVIDVNLTDGLIHPVSLYAVDWPSQGRSEEIQVLNGTTGAVLSTQTISNFTGGDYLTWNVSGNVEFQVTCESGPNAVVSGLFLGSGSPAAGGTPTPSHVYANPGTYTAALTATDSAGHSGTSSVTVTVGTTPTVTSYSPLSGATGVAASSPVTATFNEAVQSSTISFTLTNSSGTTVPATVSYNSSDDTVTLTPSSTLAYSTTYTASVSGAETAGGVPMSSPFTWTFTTDPAPTPPTVTSETPASGATNVPTSTLVTATFNQAVQSNTVTLTLKTSSGSSVGATVSYNNSTDTATLTPSAALAYSTTYTATVSGAENSAGLAMSAPFSWSFTTGATPAPYVVSEAPAAGAQSNVGVSSTVTATFSEAVQAGSISFTLHNSSGATVASSVSYNSSTDTVTLTPSSPLAYSTTYTATISGASSSSGVAMTTPCTWSFTTAATSAPYVSSQAPMPATLNVALSTVPTVTFNQPVQAGTIVFTLTNEFGNSVPGTVSYNSATNTATFTPSAPLPGSTTYTASVSGAKNSSGTAMTAPVVWEFITDPGPATVTTESPSSATTGVGTTPTITATFSEPVQASTISFTLANSGGSSVAATVTYNPATFIATLTPTSPLTASTTYTATVSGAEDLAGDPMTLPFSWSFTTASATTLQTGLVAEWQFNEGSGTATADNTGNGHTGTLVGSVSWTTGLFGPHALSFSSSGSGHVTVPDSPSLEFSSTQSFSLTAWVYVPSLPSAWTGVVTKSANVGDWYGIWISPDNQWTTGGEPNAIYGSVVSTGWSQVAIVQNGTAGTLDLYVNGVQEAAGPAQASNGTGALCIGGDNGVDPYFNGMIDDVRVYNLPLSSAELQNLASIAPPAVSVETPASGVTGTGNMPIVTATFNRPVQASTINFTLTSAAGTSVPGTVAYSSANNTATFTPDVVLASSTTYNVTISGVKNSAGTAMPAPISWSFTTGAAPGFATGASTGEYIITDANTIPNYAYSPTVTSVASGSWSSGSTWSTDQVPGAGALVSIASGTTVTYDADSATVLGAITIQPGGTLQFATNVDTEVIAGDYLVLPGGTLDVGTQSDPVAANVTATIETANQTINTTFDPSQYGDSLIGLGNVTIYGAAKTPFVQLAVAPQAGATTLYLAQPVTGWQVGDELYIPDTRQLDYYDDPASGDYVPESETATIASISPNGLVVTITSALQYSHPGAYDSNGDLTFLPQVVDETRNVVIRSQNGGGTRGVVMFLQNANVNINYADFLALGRTTDATISDTTYNSNGTVASIGTNQQDRSPVDFLDLWGPSTPQADGYQYTFNGNVVNCPMTPQDHIWGIEVNTSSYGLIQGNFVINWYGAGIALLTGAEVDNMIEGNFVTEISGTGVRDTTGLDGLGYWSPAPDDSWVNNVATDINPSGTYSYGFDIDAQYVGDNGLEQIPAYQGADPMEGQSILVNMNATPLLQFSGDETYGATPDGLELWWLGDFFDTIEGTAGVVQNVYNWNQQGWGYFGYETNDLTIDGFFDQEDPNLDNSAYLGMWFADYQQSGTVINNADIQGLGNGIFGPANAVGETLIENSYFSDAIDVNDVTTGTTSGNSGMANKSLVLQNDVFAVPSGFSLTAINMDYDPSGGVTGNLQCNLLPVDQVFVYNYDQVSGDNFQVYYTQQAASAIMPESGSLTADFIGSPVSGLTNQQNWTTYGIATAGAVAPSNATTMAGIIGLVVPLSSGSGGADFDLSGGADIVEGGGSAPPSNGPFAILTLDTGSATVPLASGPLAQPGNNSVTSSNPDSSALATVLSPLATSTRHLQKPKTKRGTVVAGPLARSVLRRSQIASKSAKFGWSLSTWREL